MLYNKHTVLARKIQHKYGTEELLIQDSSKTECVTILWTNTGLLRGEEWLSHSSELMDFLRRAQRDTLNPAGGMSTQIS